MVQTPSTWVPAEPDLESILSSHKHPLEDLAEGRVPALVIRSAWDPSFCQQLVQRLVEEELLYDPRRPIPEKFQEQIKDRCEEMPVAVELNEIGSYKVF